jgi:hypothetical protein
MLSPAAHHPHTRRRFGRTEVLLIAAIMVVGALTLFGSSDRPISSLLFGTPQVASAG